MTGNLINLSGRLEDSDNFEGEPVPGHADQPVGKHIIVHDDLRIRCYLAAGHLKSLLPSHSQFSSTVLKVPQCDPKRCLTYDLPKPMPNGESYTRISSSSHAVGT